MNWWQLCLVIFTSGVSGRMIVSGIRKPDVESIRAALARSPGSEATVKAPMTTTTLKASDR